MKRVIAILGPAPHSLDGVLSGLTRARRELDIDDETAQSSREAFLRSSSAVQLIDLLRDWLKPAVEAERSLWAAQERIDAIAKDDAAYEALLRLTRP